MSRARTGSWRRVRGFGRLWRGAWCVERDHLGTVPRLRSRSRCEAIADADLEAIMALEFIAVMEAFNRFRLNYGF